jgi:hypothetical protein
VGLHIPCSLLLAAAFSLSPAENLPEYIATYKPSPMLVFPAQTHMPTKSGNVPHIQPEEQPTPQPNVKLDPAQLQREGQELLELSQSLQVDIESLNHGLYPKGTTEKLKRIEKLAKHLRGEIAP